MALHLGSDDEEEEEEEEQEHEQPERGEEEEQTCTVFSKARGQLQLSVLPKTLPCREGERQQLFSLLQNALVHRETCSICTCPSSSFHPSLSSFLRPPVSPARI